ncbi:hypothetical protein P7K49_020695 [Saguinus oedipus]|uniref:Uncharacterized protein n=1 Tax=Saguinus oedipus TaxID=9490 RepID=A0ABQ9V2U1_SAGOE|nr:hypothetical protein P7K49_020695 [Saguinus oedipus]
MQRRSGHADLDQTPHAGPPVPSSACSPHWDSICADATAVSRVFNSPETPAASSAGARRTHVPSDPAQLYLLCCEALMAAEPIPASTHLCASKACPVQPHLAEATPAKGQFRLETQGGGS